MTNNDLIKNTKVFVKKTLIDAEGGHDWYHTLRVFNNAKLIAVNKSLREHPVEVVGARLRASISPDIVRHTHQSRPSNGTTEPHRRTAQPDRRAGRKYFRRSLKGQNVAGLCRPLSGAGDHGNGGAIRRRNRR